MGKVLPTDGIMTALQMKPLLAFAKQEPVQAAIGMTDKGDGVILLSKKVRSEQMIALLRTSAGKAKLKLDNASLRFGRAEIPEDDTALVRFFVNKDPPGGLRVKLIQVVKEIPYQKVEINVDPELGKLEEDEAPIDKDVQEQETEQDLNSLARRLDQAEQALKQAVIALGSNPKARPLLLEAGKILKEARQRVAEGNGKEGIELTRNLVLTLKNVREVAGVQVPSRDQETSRPQPRRRERSPRITHAVNRRLITTESVTQMVGKKPLKNRLGGLWKRSTRFKAVLKPLGEIETLMGQNLDQFNPSTVDELERKVNEAGGKALVAMKKYLARLQKKEQEAKKEQDDFKGDNREEYEELGEKSDQAWRRRANFEDEIRVLEQMLGEYTEGRMRASLERIMEDPSYEQVKSHLTLSEAVQVKSSGLSFSDCGFEQFGDDKLDPEKSNEAFGSGALNQVAKLTHKDGKPRIFKPEPQIRGKRKTAFMDEVNPRAALLGGIDRDEPHYGARNLASRGVGELLGTNVIPNATITSHKGVVGLLMDMAPGKTGNLAGYPFAKDMTESQLGSLHEQLSSLEWCDMITGQLDRHALNYLVDSSVDPVIVTGIDNDLSFGKDTRTLDLNQNDHEYRGTGKPGLIDRKTFDQIMRLDFDDDFLPRLQGRLTEDEIDAARERFRLVREHAQSLADTNCVVDDWSKWRFKPDEGEEMTASQYLASLGKTSLFARDFVPSLKQLNKL